MQYLFPVLSHLLMYVMWIVLRKEFEFWTFHTNFIQKNFWDSALNKNFHVSGRCIVLGHLVDLYWFGFCLFYLRFYLFVLFWFEFSFFQDNNILLLLTCKDPLFGRKNSSPPCLPARILESNLCQFFPVNFLTSN